MYALSYNKFKPQNTIIQVVTSQYDNLLEGLSRVETVCNNKQIYKKEAEWQTNSFFRPNGKKQEWLPHTIHMNF